jgi:hypothetical protein
MWCSSRARIKFADHVTVYSIAIAKAQLKITWNRRHCNSIHLSLTDMAVSIDTLGDAMNTYKHASGFVSQAEPSPSPSSSEVLRV